MCCIIQGSACFMLVFRFAGTRPIGIFPATHRPSCYAHVAPVPHIPRHRKHEAVDGACARYVCIPVFIVHLRARSRVGVRGRDDGVRCRDMDFDKIRLVDDARYELQMVRTAIFGYHSHVACGYKNSVLSQAESCTAKMHNLFSLCGMHWLKLLGRRR